MKFLQTCKHLAIAAFFVSSMGIISCNNSEADTKSETADSAQKSDSQPLHAQAVITGTYADTTVDGTATFDAVDGKVKMVLNITVPAKANQSVAVHLHEHGDCGDMGKGAHGHWNPTHKNHGKWGSADFHSGDIGNVQLDAKGKGSMELETDLWSIGGDSTTNILDKSVIVHGGVDDYTSQPAGNAGSRIGCGVIK
ncbi:MAG: superoxide dismutase family protein [Ginsengibacter sp.]